MHKTNTPCHYLFRPIPMGRPAPKARKTHWARTGTLLAMPPDGPRRFRAKDARRRTWIRPVPVLLLVVVVMAWIGFTPLRAPTIHIDGDMGDWDRVPSLPDPAGDSALVVSDPVFEFTFRRTGTLQATLKVTDARGSSSTVTGSYVVPNAPPSASFNATVTGLNVSLDASATSDPDDPIAEFRWHFGDSGTAEGPLATHTYFASGSYNVTLVVRDARGAESTAWRVVQVQGVNRPPVGVVDFAVADLTLTASAEDSYDPDGLIVDFTWDLGDGESAFGPRFTHAYGSPGAYTFSLILTDDEGAVTSVTRDVVVPNPPPEPRFTVDVDTLTVFCDARNSTDNGEVVAWLWTFGDGAAASGLDARHRYGAPGRYTIALSVTDDLRYTVSTVTSVSVSAPAGAGTPPVARASANATDLFVRFDASPSYDPDGTIAQFLWDLGDGNTSTGAQTLHLYEKREVYAVRVSVVDEDGLSGSMALTVDLRAANETQIPPVARMEIRVSGSAVRFDATGSSASVPIAAFRWILVELDGALDLVETKVSRQGSHLFLFARAADSLFSVAGAETTVAFYIGSGQIRGVPIGGIQAGFLIRIAGSDGNVRSAQLMRFGAPVPGAPFLWYPVGPVEALGRGDAVEIRVSSTLLLASATTPLAITCVLGMGPFFADRLDSNAQA